MALEVAGINFRLSHSERQRLNLKNNETVFISVIKELSASKWAIGLKGRILTAYSKLPLQKGEILKAKVIIDDNNVYLKLQKSPEDSFLNNLISKGLPSDELALLVIKNLIKNNLKLDEYQIQNIKVKLEKFKGKLKRKARIVSQLLAKGIKETSPNFNLFIREIDKEASYDSNKDNSENEKKEKLSSKEVKDIIQEAAANCNNFFKLFNLLPEKKSNLRWFAIPFCLKEVETVWLNGSIFLLYNWQSSEIEKVIIKIDDQNDQKIFFVLMKKQKGEYTLKIYSDNERLENEKLEKYAENLVKLQKLGVFCDDTIKKGDLFDGFAEEIDYNFYQEIDTEG